MIAVVICAASLCTHIVFDGLVTKLTQQESTLIRLMVTNKIHTSTQRLHEYVEIQIGLH